MKKLCTLLFVLSFLGTTAPVVADVTNGDFETGDFSGWVEAGNVNIGSDTAYQANGGVGSWPTGTYVAAFNSGDSTPNGTLSQTAPTIADQQFRVDFQFGAFSPTFAGSQTIEVEVRDGSTNALLASLTVADDTPSNNLSSLLEDRSLDFTATGSSVTISFVDLSTETNSVDGLLDNVSVVAHEIFSDGFESGDIWAWSSGFGWRECDIFAQDCGGGESCYLLLSTDHYPTVCAPAVPEPDPPDGCGMGLSRPGWQGECCSYINTCDAGFGCTQPDLPIFDHLVCASFCDPTGTVGLDNCSFELGPSFWCLSISKFYSDTSDLEEYFGFCLEDTIWGPPECWNKIQDPDEDGIDCCEPGGNPACECVFGCL